MSNNNDNKEDNTKRDDTKNEKKAGKLPYPKKYDPDPVTNKLFKPDATTVVQGRRRTGKSTLVTELLLRRRRVYPKIFMFTATKRNNYWQQYLPVHKIAEGLDDELLGNLIELNSERYEQWKIQWETTGKIRGNPLTMFVFEDLIAEKILRQAPHLETATMNGRHHGVPCIIMSQVIVGLTPNQRDNIDEWVFFRPDDPRTPQMIRETFGEDVLDVARRVWKDGRAFIVNTAPRIPIEERMFWYETDIDYIKQMTHRNVVLCNKQWWGEHDIKQQKKRYPYKELPATATLMGEFNKSVVNQDGDVEDEDAMPQIGGDDEDKKKKDETESAKKVEVHVVEKSYF